MAFKLKSALKFGQKSSFKMRSYNPLKQTKPPKKSTESAHGQLDDAEIEYQQDLKMYKEKMKRDKQLKEFLIKQKGFNQEDADRMIKDGAYTYKDMFKDVPAEGKSPNKQEGPIPKKNIKLQPGENPDTYLFGHNYGDENIPGEGEGFEPTGTRDQKFTANERIIDLEERAGFLLDNDIPDLEGSTDPKDVKRLKTLKATVKKLQGEADIMRKRRENMRKSSPTKQKVSRDDFKPAYPGADYSQKDIDKMTRKEKEMKIDGYDPKLDPTQPEYDRPDPTYEGTDEFRKEKDIPAKEFEERGLKKPKKKSPTKQK
tara:strand:+ start:2562 stop:3503 length:942 start_codon:yes stop_codon:yes gene_type:complete